MGTVRTMACGIGLAAASVFPADGTRADVIAQDDFDDAAGEIGGQNGGVGWTGGWTNFNVTAASEIVSPATPLTYNAGGGAAMRGGLTARCRPAAGLRGMDGSRVVRQNGNASRDRNQGTQKP